MNKTDFLKLVSDLDIKEIEVPTLGKLHLKAWTGKIRDDYEKSFSEKKEGRAEWICASALCDENGNLLFDYKSQADLDILKAKPAKVTLAIAEAAMGHNVLTVEADELSEKN